MSYSRDDEDMAGLDGQHIVQRTPDTDLCIVTSMARAFSRRCDELALGACRWDDCLPLKAGETVVGVMSKAEFDAVSSVVFALGSGGERTVHPSS